MDAKQLKVFMAVAQSGGFTQAATTLHIAQSAVSIAVKKLEQSLGVTLFDRSERRIRLTEEGQVLYARASQILGRLEQLRQEMSDLAGARTGKVRLGTSAMLGSYFLPDLIRDFRTQHPHIDFMVTGEGTSSAKDRLLAGEIDMAVVNLKQLPSELAFCALIREPLVVSVPVGHDFCGLSAVGIEQLLSESLIVYGQGYFLRDWLEAEASERGLSLKIVLETNLLRLVTQAVESGQGVALTLDMMAKRESGLAGVALEGVAPIELGVAWRKDRYLSLANRTFVDFLIQRNEQK